MKDYLLILSVLGLVLGFYSALVIVQSRPAHAVASHGSRSAGTLTSEVSENSTEPTTTTPLIGADQKMTR